MCGDELIFPQTPNREGESETSPDVQIGKREIAINLPTTHLTVGKAVLKNKEKTSSDKGT